MKPMKVFAQCTAGIRRLLQGTAPGVPQHPSSQVFHKRVTQIAFYVPHTLTLNAVVAGLRLWLSWGGEGGVPPWD